MNSANGPQDLTSAGTGDGDAVHQVVIIGAGPGGICAAILLRERGIEDVVVLERSAGIGGTWYNNRYPGLACDVPSDLYSYSFFQDFDWSRLFARRAEMCDYIEAAAQKFGVAEQVVVNAGVSLARWDDDASCWLLTATNGLTYRARTVIGAVGMFNESVRPEIPGLDGFQGQLIHTADWPSEDLSFLEGKTVGVIGTAASAIQVIPAIAPVVAELEVFHRTANWVFPKEDKAFDAVTRAERQADPSIVQAKRLESTTFVDTLCDFNNVELMAGLREQGLQNLTLVNDPDLREVLRPTMPIGAQRTLLSSEFYPTFNQANVYLVTSPIVEVFADAIVTGDGVRHTVDVIVLATGYAAHKFLSVVDVIGRDGVRLRELWSAGAYAYKGMTVQGLPNLFMLYGPNTNGGSIIDKLETQSRYVVNKIAHILDNDLARLEVKPDIVLAYNEQLQRDLATVDAWQVVGSRYYRAPSGRIVTQCPYPPTKYDAMTREDDLDDFVVTARATVAVS